MIIKRFWKIVFPCLFVFYSFPLDGQDTSKVSQSLINNSRQRTITHTQYLKPGSLIIPGAFLIYGGLKPVINGIPKLDGTIMENVQKNHPDFHTNAADYIMWTPSASVYVLDALKIKSEHNFRQHLLIEGGSILITGGLGLGMRIISKNIKVYNDGDTKFPSGHTANAFRGAEILHQELKRNHPVISYSGYVAAAAVGLLRIYGKEHYLTEVIAGAGLGILSTKLTYWLFDKVKKDRK